jgi:hypothetical protein
MEDGIAKFVCGFITSVIPIVTSTNVFDPCQTQAGKGLLEGSVFSGHRLIEFFRVYGERIYVSGDVAN